MPGCDGLSDDMKWDDLRDLIHQVCVVRRDMPARPENMAPRAEAAAPHTHARMGVQGAAGARADADTCRSLARSSIRTAAPRALPQPPAVSHTVFAIESTPRARQRRPSGKGGGGESNQRSQEEERSLISGEQ